MAEVEMTGTPYLRVGSIGPEVVAVRERLYATGDLRGSSESPETFDGEVERAVRSFQQRRGLLVDGIVGPQTYRTLDGARWLLGDRILMHTPGHLLMGDDVTALQERLLGLGFSSGRVDGIFGPSTDGAVRELQRGVGLPPDGVVGPKTLRALTQLSRSVRGGAPHGLREAEAVRAAGPSLHGRVIVLDPAGSSAASQADTEGLTEGEVTLDLARRIEGRLAAGGVQVVLTRGVHGDPTPSERAKLANALGADVLLSLHCESLPGSPQASGVATFFYGVPDGGNAWSPMGERLASLVQREICARTDLVDCRIHPRTWELLRHTTMPAVRVEVGHLSHPGDARRLADPAFRDTLAEAIVVAIQRMYLQDEDATTGTLRVDDVLARARRG
jgi:N-acetylmuramoyl-L-alanine amidase